MKKTNKTFKRFAAITSASLLAACAMAPVFTLAAEGDSVTPPTYSITINNSAEGHTYEAYQIFKGDLSVEDDVKILSNIVWGDDVTSSITDKTAAELAETLVDGMTGKEIIEALGITLDDSPTGTVNTSSDGKYVIDDLAAGYYLIKDKDDTLNGAYDAYTSYIIKVVGDATASPKSEFPLVDKQVLDEIGDAEAGSTDGWGETADHAINETFQFKLIATIPGDANLADYESYKVIFNDTMSNGVTFESIESVTVSGESVPSGVYVVDGVNAGDAGKTWTLEVPNVLDYDSNLTDGATIEVIYNAHLNESAQIINTTDATEITNKNTVYLEYSNNPNWTSSGESDTEDLGKTNEDTVYVATYTILNTKVDGASWDEESEEYKTVLSGAVFELHDANGKIDVIYDGTLGAYRPLKEGETAGTVTSDEKGKFNFAGLDAGTYTLKEITPPTGYNKLDDDLTITLTAVHAEDANKIGQVTLSATGDLGLDNKIENNKGASLPGTGGIGTTIFYLGGGAMAAIGGIYLVSKRRMRKSEE